VDGHDRLGSRSGAPDVRRAPPAMRAGDPGAPSRGAARASDVAVAPQRRPAFGMSNLRRNVCPHFFITGSRGALPIQAPHLLKALIRQSTTVSRCQLRGGVHMSEDFVNDVCLSARFNQCVFYEDELTREP
jgi:hypothetical protein